MSAAYEPLTIVVTERAAALLRNVAAETWDDAPDDEKALVADVCDEYCCAVSAVMIGSWIEYKLGQMAGGKP